MALPGFRVRDRLATKLVNDLVEAADDAQDHRPLRTRRSEQRRHRLPYESFDGRKRTFTDLRLCAAIADRLTFGRNIIETDTESY